ncbi:hypothetical protein ACH5RR_032141 [Cinchona calisaya]|uniref:Uncharacterized protein n=1 Tax=Cinchona calisaya TaxID=153742 RepID=A0ABD2YH84_9GENT
MNNLTCLPNSFDVLNIVNDVEVSLGLSSTATMISKFLNQAKLADPKVAKRKMEKGKAELLQFLGIILFGSRSISLGMLFSSGWPVERDLPQKIELVNGGSLLTSDVLFAVESLSHDHLCF